MIDALWSKITIAHMSHHQTRSNTYLASHLFSVKISLAEVAPIAKFHKSHKIGKICSVGKTRKFVHKCQMQSVRTINTIISYYIILSIQYSAISPYLYTFLLFHWFNMNFKHCNKIYIKHPFYSSYIKQTVRHLRKCHSMQHFFRAVIITRHPSNRHQETRSSPIQKPKHRQTVCRGAASFITKSLNSPTHCTYWKLFQARRHLLD